MRIVRLGDVVTFVRGVTFDGSEAYAAPQADTVPILRAGNIGDRLQTREDLVWVPSARISRDQLMRLGDIAMCMSSGSPKVVGKSAILDHSFEGSVGAFCGLLRPGPMVYPPFLAAWLRSPAFRSWRDGQSRGASIQNLRFSELARLALPLPTTSEQLRIAAELTDALAVVDRLDGRTRAALSTAQALAGAIRASFFSGLTAPRERLGDLIGEPGAIIDGPFGSNLKGDHYQIAGVRVIRLANIGVGEYIDVDRAYVTPEHFASLSRHAARAGDVIVAALGDGARPAGRACMVPHEIQLAMVKADCFRIRPNARLLGPFLTQYLNSPHVLQMVQSLSRGATRPRMTLDILKSLEIPIPPPDEQRRIAEELRDRLRVTNSITANVDAQLTAIAGLPAALLSSTFDGVQF